MDELHIFGNASINSYERMLRRKGFGKGFISGALVMGIGLAYLIGSNNLTLTKKKSHQNDNYDVEEVVKSED